MEATCHVDGFGPLPVVRPAQVGELGECIRQAVAAGEALYPLGGRTMLDLGLPPSKPGKAVDLTGLAQVIDYPARDMTVTVQSGITLARLNELLHAEKQRLPIDVPLPERATLGGAVATNVSGSRRFGLGTLRDYVIGITIVNDQGEEAKAGGRVVKNVAGYDLCKLYTGAMGTLGIISQITLKVKPIPEASAIVVWPTTLPALAEKLEVLHRSKTRPVAIDVISAGAVATMPAGEFLLVVGFEDNAKAVAWQLEQIANELPGGQRLGDDVLTTTWNELRDFALQPNARLIFKANLLPSGVPEFLSAATASPLRPLLQAHAGSGIIKGHIVADLTQEQATTMLNALQAVVNRYQGNLVVTRCPSAWKAVVPVWGRSTADRSMMRLVKDKLDPTRVFNPGRFVDGI